MELDGVPLWRGDHVTVKQLVEDFARYLYLPRLKESAVLLDAICDGVNLMTWVQESFAFADRFDEGAGRYQGLRAGKMISISDPYAQGVVVKAEVAEKQLNTELAGTATGFSPGRVDSAVVTMGTGTEVENPPGEAAPEATRSTRFHGTADLDPTRVGRDASRIAEEVISHLVGLVGARVTVSIEVQAEIPAGVPDHVVRTVTENSRTLKFTSQGFENE